MNNNYLNEILTFIFIKGCRTSSIPFFIPVLTINPVIQIALCKTVTRGSAPDRDLHQKILPQSHSGSGAAYTSKFATR